MTLSTSGRMRNCIIALLWAWLILGTGLYLQQFGPLIQLFLGLAGIG